mmetsp:Transcript_30061/g.82555  ORF Transcript_30061/g.82555 Transcript_30061/m.82555 type:complete len:261 (-) Transcript_30061:609-1391(-)
MAARGPSTTASGKTQSRPCSPPDFSSASSETLCDCSCKPYAPRSSFNSPMTSSLVPTTPKAFARQRQISPRRRRFATGACLRCSRFSQPAPERLETFTQYVVSPFSTRFSIPNMVTTSRGAARTPCNCGSRRPGFWRSADRNSGLSARSWSTSWAISIALSSWAGCRDGLMGMGANPSTSVKCSLFNQPSPTASATLTHVESSPPVISDCICSTDTFSFGASFKSLPAHFAGPSFASGPSRRAVARPRLSSRWWRALQTP